jgi:predicted AlkP superfamily phosphohydrolase/phosphomutase
MKLIGKLFDWFLGIFVSFDIWRESQDKKAIVEIMEAEKMVAELERDIEYIRRTGKKFKEQND